MLPEFGHFALILAMLLAACQAFFGIAGPTLGRDRWVAAVTPAVAGQFVMVATAVACLIASFIGNDFSVIYVAETSNSALPLFYRATAMWGGHEGSILLWIFILACWTLAVSIGTARLPQRFAARVLGVLGVLSFGFLLFTLATSNPFLRRDPPFPDGRDLNPQLQDPTFAIHPPVLYLGYVGLAVAFAFAAAAMLEGRLDQTWARWTRPWTTVAWAFLGLGIALGSWWAYYDLGWGGYWAWDPVENGSFMPWLLATALIHSLAVTEKRGLFKSWSLLLAVLGFSLSMMGTFLTRSGITLSVHSFAADPKRGVFILAFLVLMIGGALALYAWRAPALKSQAGFELAARESFLLFNNILLVTGMATVMVGTLAPVVAQALNISLSVGPPYFNPTFMVSMLPLLALLPVGVHARWKKGHLSESKRLLFMSLGVAALLGLVLVLGVYGRTSVLAPVGATLGFWIILSSLYDPIDRLRRKLSLSRAVLGMSIAHIGLGVAVVALTTVGAFTVERDVALAQGQSTRQGGYDFRFDGLKSIEGPNYDGIGGTVTVSKDGEVITVMHPEKRRYWAQPQSPTTQSSIEMHGGSNILVALGEDVGAGRWSLRVQIRPLVTFLWIGALIMAVGGCLAATDRRYRLVKSAEPSEEPETPLTGAGAPAGSKAR